MELEISEKRYDSFIDSNGKKVPIHESYLYYAPTDDNFFEELDVVVIDDENEKTSKHRKFKSRHWEEHKSIEEFFWPRPSFKNRHGVGLYKDYNPKLNSGAPGNVKERRRCERIFAEDSKWNPIIIDYYEEDNIIDTILEDDEVTKTFDMVIVILDDYYVNRKAS
ncbi:hypothetical protein COT98_03645 [Candidatus Falkowbacteria bacterium CG10_big_fil_rev_8_21_14_0_10_39_9]|uniref:Uncharacterized protein n=1 Tax=Candidatus Falkowbacteria bacterium CG10_big_fil_rev_8_21_14_0_10_39_9 TaxID=1974566 RepID=A0A2M6WNL4_9BACT|nr:MAG: hypothetical protein COT98_03645 [Candidatus Falkowbacteria bacterium CG10_big_fil_rev_8_21_14_0_10_39_9]